MPIDLKNLTTGQKVFGVALIGVVVLALYAKSKRGNAATSGTVPISGGTGTVPAQQDLSSITSAVQAAFQKVVDSNTAIEHGLSQVIADSNKATVDALNSQSSTFADALKTLGTGNQKAIGDLQKAEAGGFTALNTYLNGAFGDIKSSQQGGFTTLGTSLAQQLAAINNLVSLSDAQRDREYLQVGLQSSAACENGGGYATTCVQSHLPDYVGGNWAGGNLSENEIRQFAGNNLRARYPECVQGGHFDLVCVGKHIVNQGYGAS